MGFPMGFDPDKKNYYPTFNNIIVVYCLLYVMHENWWYTKYIGYTYWFNQNIGYI